MFKGFNFTVIPFGVDIGKKRKKVLEDLIVKNEGKLIKLEKINNNLIPDFILTSKNVKNIFDLFPRKQLGSIPKEERTDFLNNIFKRIINYEWLSKCILQKKIIDVDDYLINIEEISIKKESRNKVFSQDINKIQGIEQLKEESYITNSDKSFSQQNQNNIQNNLNNSPLKINSSFSSFDSNAFDLDSDLNLDEISNDEELFNKITDLIVNKNEKEEEENTNNNKIDKNTLIISESQEITNTTSSLDTQNISKKEGVN